MMMLTITATLFGLFGASAAIVGVTQIVSDPRRIAAYAYALLGGGAALLSAGLLLYVHADQQLLLVIAAIIALIALVFGNLIGYPLLVGVLLWAGVTTLHRESRSLANMLSLLAGIGLLFLPTTLGLFEPAPVARDDVAYYLQYSLHLALVLLITYLACCFAAFAVASLAYRWRKPHRAAEAIIVLGSGLVNGKVPPLLAGRLKRGITAMREDNGKPIMITSGGQGDHEPRSEGAAMRDYVIEQGIDADRVVAEEYSTTTEENLMFSQKLLSAPTAPVTVVTSSYHVFRAALLTRSLKLNAHVVGAPTARYYLPGAVIREFAAVMRDYLRIHLVAVIGIVILTMAFTTWILPASVSPATGL